MWAEHRLREKSPNDLKRILGRMLVRISSLSSLLWLAEHDEDTHYVDFMSYSEKPMKKFKSLFRHLYEVAAWHRPTVLIFDNLDKVLSPEQEVRRILLSMHPS